VADKLGVALNGTADQMIAEISESGWTQHGKDGQAAREAAKAGALVVGGMTSQDLGQRSWTSRYRS
jgi:hypothetical protein